MVKKGYKISKEGNFKQGSFPNQIVWKRVSTNVKQEALETAAAMGSFAGENYDSVSMLNKSFEEKEKELQKYK